MRSIGAVEHQANPPRRTLPHHGSEGGDMLNQVDAYGAQRQLPTRTDNFFEHEARITSGRKSQSATPAPLDSRGGAN